MLTWKWDTTYSHKCFHSLKASIVEHVILYQGINLNIELLYLVDFCEIFQNSQTVTWCSTAYIIDQLHPYNTGFVQQL